MDQKSTSLSHRGLVGTRKVCNPMQPQSAPSTNFQQPYPPITPSSPPPSASANNSPTPTPNSPFPLRTAPSHSSNGCSTIPPARRQTIQSPSSATLPKSNPQSP